MRIHPVLSAMRCNKTGVVLAVLQVALTLAITCNAVFIIHDRLQSMDRPTGMDVDDIFYVTSVGYAPDYDAENSIRSYLDALLSLPGVVDAAAVHQIPLSLGGWSTDFHVDPDPRSPTVDAGVMHVDEHGLRTLGLKLVAGRDFTAAEIEHASFDSYHVPPLAMVTQAAADQLFPGGAALGKTLYSSDDMQPVTIIGVVERMQGFRPHWSGFERTVIMPTVFDDTFCRFLVRTQPGERARVMREARHALEALHTGAYVRSLRSLDDYRDNSYADDHAMTVALSVVTGLILAITALGMVGLASFSVRQRVRQIGTRRALGARRADIVYYFVIENWLISSMGAALGCLFAVGLNYCLVRLYELPSLAWYYLPLGVLGMWLLGLLSALVPALKAASIPPSIATRSV